MLLCANDSRLLLRTPSGTYPVAIVDYADPHLVDTNPSMWSCRSSDVDVDGAVPPRRPANPFSLDSSTRFSAAPSRSSTAARTPSSSSPSPPSVSASWTVATPPATASATCAATCRIAPT
ncbi:hypothetical protein Cni_G09714 [Canna indica]|uniref:Uncharacterized protein n=1 Tax=Canna indica TaxID=4628 RepID=A0AAQ3K8L3_9LILI|nr:hypothetical protein Cni_G09714 [Canna indica]